MQDRNGRHPDEMISALFDGELAPEEWTAVKAHLEECRRCRRLLEEIKAISAAMPADPPVPEGLAARVRERLPAGTGRQRPAPPRRDPMHYKPARRRITFPLAAGAGLAAALIVGALLVQYVPSSVLSRLRLPQLSAEEGAEGPGGAAAGRAKDQGSVAAKRAPEVEQPGGPVGGISLPAEPGADGSDAASEFAQAPVTEAEAELVHGAKGEVAAGNTASTAVPPGDFAAAGERPGLAPGQELPVTVPEEADEPARSAEEIALDAARPGAAGGLEGTATAAASEPQVPARDEVEQARRAQEAVLPPTATAKSAAAPAAAAAVPPPPPAETTAGGAAGAAPVAPAASVAECRATWGSPRQANWPAAAGRNPERAVGGAGRAAGGKSIVLENPRRVRVTVTRERWPELMQRLAAAGVTGTAQLPAPPEWADCAAVNVSVPEASAAPPSPPPPPADTPPAPPPSA
jgi:hypothetical protein